MFILNCNQKGWGIPPQNSSSNGTINDVIGSKADRAFSNFQSDPPHPSIIGHLTANYYHVHDASRVYPRTSDNAPLSPITITGGAVAWSFGLYQEIIGFSSKTVMADVHFVILGDIGASDDYVLQLATGPTGSQEFWGECAFTRDTNQMRASWVPIQGKPIPAGTKLWARVASASGGEDTVKIKVFTHQYPSVTGNS